MARPRTVSDEEIVQAAAGAIGREGPHRVTLSAIAEEAGISPPALVQRFGSKRGLLLAVAERAPRFTARMFEEAREEGGSPVETLAELLEGAAGMVGSPEEIANHLAFLQIDLGDPEFHAHALRHSREMRTGIREFLERALREGELAGCDPAELARAVHAAYLGSLIGWAIRREGEVGEVVRRDVEEVLRPYLRAR